VLARLTDTLRSVDALHARMDVVDGGCARSRRARRRPVGACAHPPPRDAACDADPVLKRLKVLATSVAELHGRMTPCTDIFPNSPLSGDDGDGGGVSAARGADVQLVEQ